MEQLKIFDLIRGEEPRSIGKTVFDTRGRARGMRRHFEARIRQKNSIVFLTNRYISLAIWSEILYSFSDEVRI